MRNRIGKYFGDPADFDRAMEMLAFCNAVWNLHSGPIAWQEWEFESLSLLAHDAATVLTKSHATSARIRF